MFNVVQYDFTRRKFCTLLVCGVLLWAVAALVLHYLGPRGVYNGTARLMMYVLIFPGTWLTLLIVQKLVGFTDRQFVVACSVMLLSATIVDGIVLAWFPWIYGDSPELIAGAGGTILWGAGMVLLVAFLQNNN